MRAPEKLPAHTHIPPPLHAGSTSAANAGATPLLPPAGTSLETLPLQGLAAPAARPATPRSPPRTKATAARGGDAQPLQSGRHSGDPPRTPAGRARSGIPGARLARSTTRWPRATFQPKAGRRAGRKEQAGRAASRLRRDPHLGARRQLHSSYPGSGLLLARGCGNLARHGPGARRTPAAAQPARCAWSSGGPGEGRTRRPGQGERTAPPTRRRRAGTARRGSRTKLRDR